MQSLLNTKSVRLEFVQFGVITVQFKKMYHIHTSPGLCFHSRLHECSSILLRPNSETLHKKKSFLEMATTNCNCSGTMTAVKQAEREIQWESPGSSGLKGMQWLMQGLLLSRFRVLDASEKVEMSYGSQCDANSCSEHLRVCRIQLCLIDHRLCSHFTSLGVLHMNHTEVSSNSCLLRKSSRLLVPNKP